MISKTLKVSLLVVALCATSFISAQERPRRANPEKLFQKLDADANGELSLEEFKSKRKRQEIKAEVMEAHFQSIDEDANGALTLEEFISGKEKSKDQRIEKHFSEMDSNGDGNIDVEEYKTFVESTNERLRHGKQRRHKRDR